MSSLRTAVQRRTYLERSQPGKRKDFGLLEKHSDYVLRARDFESKRKKLGALHEKARLRNPDEFSFKMVHRQFKASNVNVVEAALSEEQRNLLEDSSHNFLSVHKTSNLRKIEGLKSNLHCQDSVRRNNQILFVSDDEEDDYGHSAVRSDDDCHSAVRSDSNVLDRRAELQLGCGGSSSGGGGVEVSNSCSSSSSSGGAVPTDDDIARQEAELEAYEELQERKEHVAKIDTVLQRMELRRDLTKKGRRFMSKREDGSTVVRWAPLRAS